jgi:hypothetical protein
MGFSELSLTRYILYNTDKEENKLASTLHEPNVTKKERFLNKTDCFKSTVTETRHSQAVTRDSPLFIH